MDGCHVLTKVYVINKMQNGESLLNANGMPKKKLTNPWNGLYCVGLGMAGLAGISRDAKSVAADIKSAVDSMGPF